MIQHLEEQLSAYLDGALEREEGAAVEAHLAACGRCRTRLVELREVSGLLAALPQPAPRRSLVPRWSGAAGRSPSPAPHLVRRVPRWLVGVRLVAGFSAAAFVLVFAVSSVTLTGARLEALPAAAPAVPQLDAVATAVPQPAAAPAAVQTTADTGAKFQTAATATPLTRSAAGAPTPSPVVVAESRPTPVPRGAAPEERATQQSLTRPSAPPAWLWLAAAVIAAALAVASHFAIRRARS